MYPGIDPNVMQQLLARLGPQQFQKPMPPQQMPPQQGLPQQMPPAQASPAPMPPSYLPMPQGADTVRPGMPPAPTPMPVSRPGHPNAFQNLAQTLGIRPPMGAAGFEPPGMAVQAVPPGLRVTPEMMGPPTASGPMIKPMPEVKPPEMKPPEPMPPAHDGARFEPAHLPPQQGPPDDPRIRPMPGGMKPPQPAPPVQDSPYFEPASARVPTQLGPPEVASGGPRYEESGVDEMPPGIRGGPRPAPQPAIGAQPGNRARQILGRPRRGLARGQRPVGAANGQGRPHRKPMRRAAQDSAKVGSKLVRKLGHRVRPDAAGGHPAAAAARSAFAHRVARRL